MVRQNNRGNKKDISIYGQEYTGTTYKPAKMNLSIHGISANLGMKADDTFSKDQHPDLKADYIMANPPFNQKDRRASDELTDDPRWTGYEVPSTGNANYGWIPHMDSKLSKNGVAGFILANGENHLRRSISNSQTSIFRILLKHITPGRPPSPLKGEKIFLEYLKGEKVFWKCLKRG